MNPEQQQENNYSAGVTALFNAFRYLFAFFAVSIVILLILYVTLGGSFEVEQSEQVLVMNFGVLEKKPYQPGWHWNWPEPISAKVRLPGPENIQSLTTESFWFYMKPGEKFSPDNYTKNTTLTPGKDGYLLTGDANIIHGTWMMYYHIEDPVKYYLKCMTPADPKSDDNEITDPKTGDPLGTRGPKTLLKSTLDNAIIKVCALNTIDYAWKDPAFHDTVENAVKAAVMKLDIGVVVDRVAVVQRTTPPMGAYQAFMAVTEAQVKSNTEKHKAENYAIRTKNEADSTSAAIVADAETYSIEVVESIKSQTKTFKAILKEYKENPDTVPVALYSDTLSDVLTSADDIFILRANDKGNQEIRILLNREPGTKKEKGTDKDKAE